MRPAKEPAGEFDFKISKLGTEWIPSFCIIIHHGKHPTTSPHNHPSILIHHHVIRVKFTVPSLVPVRSSLNVLRSPSKKRRSPRLVAQRRDKFTSMFNTVEIIRFNLLTLCLAVVSLTSLLKLVASVE